MQRYQCAPLPCWTPYCARGIHSTHTYRLSKLHSYYTGTLLFFHFLCLRLTSEGYLWRWKTDFISSHSVTQHDTVSSIRNCIILSHENVGYTSTLIQRRVCLTTATSADDSTSFLVPRSINNVETIWMYKYRFQIFFLGHISRALRDGRVPSPPADQQHPSLLPASPTALRHNRSYIRQSTFLVR
jgi:hypothetical protein